LAYDDITITDAAGNAVIIEGFEDLSENGYNGRIWFRANPQQDSDVYFFESMFEPHSGTSRLEFGFGLPSIAAGVWYGVAPFDLENHTAPVFPILVSPRFVEVTKAQIHDQMSLRVRQSPVSSQSILVQIVGVVDYFPTMYEQSEMGYVITLRDPLLASFNNTRHSAMQPNELLLQDQPSHQLLNQAIQIITVQDVEQALRAFPLAVGLRTASALSYILATAISLGGFVAHLVFIVSQRRSQFALLRAIGLENIQLYGILLIEQVVLILFGLRLGTGLGVLLTWLTLNNLNFDWGGIANAPPFEVIWDWRALLQTYALFLVVLFVALTLAIAIIRRTAVQRTLRMAVE
jgi:hypothetical protein